MQKTLIYIDANTKRQILSNGASADRVANYVTLERGQWNILCLWFKTVVIDTNGEVIVADSALSEASAYEGVGDNDFIDSTSLMFRSLQSATPFSEYNPESNMFNIAGDWIDGGTADMSKGQMSIRINCDTAKFIEVMRNVPQVTSGLYINVKMYDSGLQLPSTIAWLPFVGANTIKSVTSSQIVPSDGYASIAYTNAVIMGGMDIEFSVDGINDWHEIQTENDQYFHERSRILGGDWSDAVALLKGQRGDTGTIFTPSVDSAGNLSWSNDSGEDNPPTVNIKGSKGTTFTPSVDSSGNISWSNDSGEENPATVNIKGEKGDSGTGLNPRGEYSSGETYVMTATARDTVQFQGSQWSCKVATTSGNEPPVYPITSNDYWDLVTAKGNDGANGATFIPSVDSAGILSFTNSAGLPNPDPVLIKGEIGSAGATYTPSIDSAGNLSFTNNAGLPNPDTVNIKGADGQFENGVPDFEFDNSDLSNGVLTKTFVELGVVGECPVEVYDNDGYKKDGDSQVIVRWTLTGITVDVSAIAGGITGTWKLKFAGGVSGVNVIVTSALPENPDSGTLYLIAGEYDGTFPVIVESVDTDDKTASVQRLQRDSGNTSWENYGEPVTVFYDWSVGS